MRFTYPALALFISLAAAGDIDANDLPTECKEVCSPVVSLTASCDAKTSDDDTAELSCVCKGKNASSILPMCDACITKYSKDGSDNDANDLVRSCSFTTTSFNPSATAAGGASESAASGTTTGSVSTTAGSGATSTSGMASSSETSGSSSASASASATNAAIGISKPGVGTVGSVVAGIYVYLAV
ncbi:hypothetical protein N7452_003289 [Penicillium brevicompactum]|uniref:GPI anchored protein n=1 Tax=Penicillium brevicompactum TaxID=5074 RepID=A0A9W9QT93_PENBR|nr:hypothetical protein N7452_003289 [Penicillium brevicompactum]